MKLKIFLSSLVFLGLWLGGYAYVALTSPTKAHIVAENSAKAEQNLAIQIQQTLQAYNRLAVETFVQPGWLHLVTQITMNNTDAENEILSGTNTVIDDAWYKLDEHGEIITAIQLLKNADGEVIQAAIYTGGTSWYNLTFAEFVDGTPQPLTVQTIDGGFGTLLENTILGNPESVSAYPTTLNSLAVLRVQIDLGDAPNTGEEHLYRRAYYVIESGICKRLETVRQSTDGSESVVNANFVEPLPSGW